MSGIRENIMGSSEHFVVTDDKNHSDVLLIHNIRYIKLSEF